MLAFVTIWDNDSRIIKAVINQLIMLRIPFDGWEQQQLSRDLPPDLEKFDGIIIDEERFRQCTPAEKARLEKFVRDKYIHIIPAECKNSTQNDAEFRAEIDLNMFAAATNIRRTGLPALETRQILQGYMQIMENFYQQCLENYKFLHEYHLHSTVSLLLAEKAGLLPASWSGRIDEILNSISALVTTPAFFDEVASWGLARLASQRCGNRKFLEKVHAESCKILSGMCRADDGMLSMGGWQDDPLFFQQKNSAYFGSTWSTNNWRDLHLNEQLHYFGSAFPALSMATGDMRFMDEAVRLMDHIEKIHRDPADGLLRHASLHGNALGAKWGRGNCHALMGAFYMLFFAPDMPENLRQRVIHFIDRTGEGLLMCQTENGLWRNVLDHPGSGEETSCSVMFTLIFAYGIRNGFFPAEKYRDMVLKSGKALKSRFWHGWGCANCRATFPAADLQFYLRRPLNMSILPLIAPALAESDALAAATGV